MKIKLNVAKFLRSLLSGLDLKEVLGNLLQRMLSGGGALPPDVVVKEPGIDLGPLGRWDAEVRFRRVP